MIRNPLSKAILITLSNEEDIFQNTVMHYLPFYVD